MSCGEKIAKLRKQHNLTQSELGVELCVTYQAVSKWERNESQPDFTTISKIAKLFEVPISYFEDDADESVILSDVQHETASAEATAEPRPTEARVVGLCVQCGKIVHEGEEGETSPRLICSACRTRNLKEERRAALAAQKAHEDEEKRRAADMAYRRAAKKRAFNSAFLWAIIPAVVMLIIGLALSVKNDDYAVLGGAATIAVFLYTFTVQMVWGGAIRSIAFAGGWGVRLPGVIFSLSFDGIVFLIAAKILLGLVAAIVFVGSIVICFCGAIIISPFTFVPSLLLHLRDTRIA